jgi:hypothetical protein
MHCIVRHATVVAGLSLACIAASAQQAPARAGLPTWMSTAPAGTFVDPNVATSTFTGTFVLNFTVTIKSIVPGAFPIHCTATILPIDASGLSYTEIKSVAGTRSSNTATCSISIPYSWILASTGTAMVQTQYMVGTQGTGSSLVLREATGSLPGVTLPANTTTLTRSVAVTI